MRLLASLKGVTARADGVLAKTDDKMFGQGGVMDETQKSMLAVERACSPRRATA